ENTVIINSIGTANPNVSKILSDAFKMPQEFILKLLYNAPSVLFQKVDLKLAKSAEDILSKLGLDVKVIDKKELVPLVTEEVEVSLFCKDILQLPKVITQLSVFLGCKPAEALNMLLAKPSVVLGRVSKATAVALQERVDASVCFSNPRKDLFTIAISKDFHGNDLKKLTSKIKQPIIKLEDNSMLIKDLSYTESSGVWREYQSKKQVRIINQTHQLVTIELTSFDSVNESHRNYLMKEVGIPSEILSELEDHLPITLFEQISSQSAKIIVEKCTDLGIETELIQEDKTTRKLRVTNVDDYEGVKNILAQFIDVTTFKKGTSWESPNEIPDLIARYLHAQLELLDCKPEIN
ncbi:hypothetical protein OAT18_03150, partial [Tenacibaculum sp.]|nr:hypothetical protein [Tenacibaculum sp.]